MQAEAGFSCTDKSYRERANMLIGKEPSLKTKNNRPIEIPTGFVCAGNLPEEIGNEIRREAYPMRLNRFGSMRDCIRGFQNNLGQGKFWELIKLYSYF